MIDDSSGACCFRLIACGAVSTVTVSAQVPDGVSQMTRAQSTAASIATEQHDAESVQGTEGRVAGGRFQPPWAVSKV
ncbi:MAG: hypothetical protein ABUS79_23995 [Pseudomonadota bacterium]